MQQLFSCPIAWREHHASILGFYTFSFLVPCFSCNRFKYMFWWRNANHRLSKDRSRRAAVSMASRIYWLNNWNKRHILNAVLCLNKCFLVELYKVWMYLSMCYICRQFHAISTQTFPCVLFMCFTRDHDARFLGGKRDTLSHDAGFTWDTFPLSQCNTLKLCTNTDLTSFIISQHLSVCAQFLEPMRILICMKLGNCSQSIWLSLDFDSKTYKTCNIASTWFKYCHTQ